MRYALDTNIVIHYLRKNPSVKQNVDVAIDSLLVPSVVDYELRRGLGKKNAENKHILYRTLLQRCRIVDMNRLIWERAIEIYADLRSKSFTVGELDILIAATCLVHDCVLVTANTKDFEKIEGLGLIDWTH